MLSVFGNSTAKLLWETKQVLPCFHWLDGHDQLLLDLKQLSQNSNSGEL